MTIRAVLFDLDDTLYPCADYIAQATKAQVDEAVKHGIDPEVFIETLAKHGWARSSKSALATLGRLDIDSTELDKAINEFEVGELLPYPGAEQLLRDLRQEGIKLGVVTNGLPARQLSKLRGLGIHDLLDVIVVADNPHMPKPDPSGFMAALAELEVEPFDALMVGDRPDTDILGARCLGMQALRIRQGYHAEMESSGYGVEVSTYSEAWEYVRAVALPAE